MHKTKSDLHALDAEISDTSGCLIAVVTAG